MVQSHHCTDTVSLMYMCTYNLRLPWFCRRAVYLLFTPSRKHCLLNTYSILLGCILKHVITTTVRNSSLKSTKLNKNHWQFLSSVPSSLCLKSWLNSLLSFLMTTSTFTKAGFEKLKLKVMEQTISTCIGFLLYPIWTFLTQFGTVHF